jgi:beta-glucosidase
MMATCLEHGIAPVVTYCHFTTPRWFAGQGGWASDDAVDRFARFATRATEHLGDVLGWVATLNEPNVITMMELTGVLPMGTATRPLDAPVEGAAAGLGGYDPARYRMGLMSGGTERMAAIHRAAVEAIKSGPGDAKVGWTLALVDLQAGDGGDERLAAARQGAQFDYLDVSKDDDWVGVQTYSRNVLGPDRALPVPEGVPTMQTGWEVYPEALGHTVRLAAERSGVPVIVTENGMATDDDAARLAYTRAALEGLAGCIADGVDVRGYLHWTLLDNFEWMAGFAKTFGLVAFDPATFERTVKPTARWLGEVARANALV